MSVLVSVVVSKVWICLTPLAAYAAAAAAQQRITVATLDAKPTLPRRRITPAVAQCVIMTLRSVPVNWSQTCFCEQCLFTRLVLVIQPLFTNNSYRPTGFNYCFVFCVDVSAACQILVAGARLTVLSTRLLLFIAMFYNWRCMYSYV